MYDMYAILARSIVSVITIKWMKSKYIKLKQMIFENTWEFHLIMNEEKNPSACIDYERISIYRFYVCSFP